MKLNKKINKKINTEMKIGFSLFSIFLLWGFFWFIYSRVINGSFNIPYIPTFDLVNELRSPVLSSCFSGECFIFGTDNHGRSLFEVVSSGLLYSLGVSFSVSFLSAIIGIGIGYCSANGSTSLRNFFDLLTNVIFIFPSILIAIMFMSFWGQSIYGLVITLVFTGWPSYARVTKSEIIRVMGLPYVEGAKAIGISNFRLLIKVLIPAILPFILIQFILGLSGVIISESTLGFLGLGVSDYSWGTLLSMGKTVLLEAPHVTFILSFVMAALIIGLNLLGDGLRDFLDPRKK